MYAQPPAHRSCASLLGTLILVVACATPSVKPLDLEASELAWTDRVDVESLEVALAGADVAATAIVDPDPEARRDQASDAFWQASALAWNPRVRATRNEVLALRQDLRSAGAPGPVWVRAVDHQFGGEDSLFETIATFDLIGLLGLGPAEAAKELADAQVIQALSQHEEALWAARMEVERARVQLSAARARLVRIDELQAEARADDVRITILERNGREAPSDVDAARARIDVLERLRSIHGDAVAEASRRLQAAAGLPAGHPAIDLVDAAHVAGFREREAPTLAGDEDARALTHPTLRRARLDFALAEANIRQIAAEAWPGIRLGPHLAFGPGTNIGGVLQLSLPWPSAWKGRLAGAEERREGARLAFEDAWIDLHQRDDAALRRLELARERAADATRNVDDAMQSMWLAARARYRNGAMPLMRWIDVLEMRTNALLLPVDDAEAIALAWLDLLDARGPAAVGESFSVLEEARP
ncbi:MAG: TolC family protein [Planctomycetota bacterium]